MGSKDRAGEKGKRDRKKKYIIKEEWGAPSIGPQAMDGSTWHQRGLPGTRAYGVGRTPWACQGPPDWCAHPLCWGLPGPIHLPLLPSPPVALWLPGTQPGHIASF